MTVTQQCSYRFLRKIDTELSSLQRFYLSVGYRNRISADDKAIVALIGVSIIGVARLCQEEGVQVLRGVQVELNHQRNGVGAGMLRVIVQHMRSTCYCIPYAHLKGFYSTAGFEEILAVNAPKFLQDRLAKNRRANPGKQYIIMARFY